MSELRKKLVSFRHLGLCVPSYMHDSLLGYLESGLRPGDFLSALLIGDYYRACAAADLANYQNLAAYAAFLYNYADPSSYGSKEKVVSWIDTKQRLRNSN